MTALHLAAMNWDLAVIKCVLDSGVNFGARSEYLRTPPDEAKFLRLWHRDQRGPYDKVRQFLGGNPTDSNGKISAS